MADTCKVLITGATGYIGRRLKDQLLNHPELTLRLLVRNRHKVRPEVLARVEVAEGDTFSPEALAAALSGIEVAFYLIHSMGSGQDFAERDRQSAVNFRDACIAAGVKRLVYLGGLGVKESASRHLLSRIETGELLSSRPEKLQTIWFRAGIIIGAGSASFEIIYNLLQKLPLMVTPKWVTTRTQPVAVDDVLAYLEAAIAVKVQGNLVVDIGGEAMSFREMMLRAAKIMGLRRFLLPVPVLSPRLSSFWLILFTPIPYRMAAALVEGLRSETVIQNDHAQRHFPGITPRSYESAVKAAIAELEQDLVISRWCDSSTEPFCDIKHQDNPGAPILRDQREIPLHGLDPAFVYAAVKGIGGAHGWGAYNMLWQIRGFLDKLSGGYGLNRGRRQQKELRVGDALDFWKVADLKENKRVLLVAQMKVPGKAWLEFDIQDDRLVQTAHFHPRGLLGRLYWYAVLPFHELVFKNLAEKIVAHAAAHSSGTISSPAK
ncbi:MAG: SDR family oxidoreductase [Proteobacteria bacterium]|nr:SDR family oxidoreductase [Pseudomonadota bacterium]MBU1545750.1 SDR family oxidoreductase [Pseudomonadota bacterium]MBU2618434.1 SDR family oxidoreductase [Pseudomonadota bacterium]